MSKKNIVFHGFLQVDGVQDNLLSLSYWRPTSVIRHLSLVFGALVSCSARWYRVRRVSQVLPGKVQSLLVSFTDFQFTTAAYFVSNARQLRGAAETYIRKTVFINPDIIKDKSRQKQPTKNSSTVVYLGRLMDQLVVVHLSRLHVLLQTLHRPNRLLHRRLIAGLQTIN